MKITRVLVMGDSYIKVSQLARDVAQHEPGHMGIRLQLRSPFKIGPRRFRSGPLPLLQTFVGQFARARGRGSAARRGSLRRLRRIACPVPEKHRTDISQKPPERPRFAPVTHRERNVVSRGAKSRGKGCGLRASHVLLKSWPMTVRM